jgi:hypothetical protein
MRSIHPVLLGAISIWTCVLLLAVCCKDLSASAGRLPGSWTGAGMIFALVQGAVVVVGVWYLPATLPRILSRMLQLIGMAGAVWSAGTLTRAIYALTA